MKFSIRDLLLVTVIVALAFGWWVEREHRPPSIDLRSGIAVDDFGNGQIDRPAILQKLKEVAPAPNQAKP